MGAAAGARGALERFRAMPVVVAAGLATGVFGGIAMTRRAPRAASDVSVIAVEAPVAPHGDAARSVDAGPALAPTPVASGDEGPALRRLVIPLVVEPADAIVTVDGVGLTAPEIRIELAPGAAKRIQIEARAKGYRRYRASRTIDSDRPLTIKLRPAGRRSGDDPSGPGGLIQL